MKYLAWFSAVLVVLVAIIYVVAFTSVGNSLVRPLVENKIQEQTNLESKLTTFSLSMSDFEVVLELSSNNIIKINGEYSLFSQAFDLNYNITLESLESLKPLTGSQLQGAFHTNGTVKGDMSFTEVNGKSDVGESDTSYHIELTELNPTSIIAKVDNAKLASLLYLGAQNPYATAEIDLDINFKNIKPHLMDGDIVLKTKNGNINPKFMKSDFNVTIPKTSFSMNLDAKLQGDDIEYRYDLSSNLFKILSSGNLTPEPLKTDIKYSLNIKELEVLKPITGADIRGVFNISGTIKGNKENLLLKGESDLASSDTKFEAVLKDFEPATAKVTVDNLKLEKALYMVKQPHYTDGLLSLNIDISDARSGMLNGKVITTVTNGLLDSDYLTRAYEFKSAMPHTAFNSTATTMLNGDIVDTKFDFNSNIANLDIKKVTYNIKENSLSSDYEARIADLDMLFFVTGQHMKGDMIINGEISKAKDLDLTLHTEVADGKIDAKLHNDDFHADINGVQTTGLLHMLTYPEVFKSSLNAKLDYDLAQSKGVISGHLVDGVFAKNQTFDLIKQYVKFDMYRERFNGDIGAKINKENIVASLDLRSKQSSITTKDAKLNTKTQQIDSDITIKAKEDSISANLKGDIDSPKVSVDLEKFIKSEAGKKVIKEVNKLFKKFF